MGLGTFHASFGLTNESVGLPLQAREWHAQITDQGGAVPRIVVVDVDFDHLTAHVVAVECKLERLDRLPHRVERLLDARAAPRLLSELEDHIRVALAALDCKIACRQVFRAEQRDCERRHDRSSINTVITP